MPFTREPNENGTVIRYRYFNADGKQMDGLSCGVDHEKSEAFKDALEKWELKWRLPGERSIVVMMLQGEILKAMEEF